MADLSHCAAFFDIGDTLASVRISADGTDIEELVVFDGIPEILRRLQKDGVHLGIISNRGTISEENVNKALKRAGLLQYFNRNLIIYGPKNSSEIFEYAAVVLADGLVMGGMSYELDPSLRQAPSEQTGVSPIGLNDAEIDGAVREAQTEESESDGGETGGVPATVPQETSTGATGIAGQLLSQLGVSDATSGKVNGVRVRKVLVEVDLDS